jgi:NADH dehydrogenase FAD-containing subunit
VNLSLQQLFIYLGTPSLLPHLCAALLTPLLPSPDGFLLVDDCLRSEGGPPNVFAAGDVASNRANPRPKAGVFAVRAVSAAVMLHHWRDFSTR